MRKFFPYLLYITLLFFSVSCSKKVVPTESVVISSEDSSNQSELEYQYTFTEANKQLLFGNIKQAALLFSKCVELDSTRSMPYFQLSNIYYRAGDAKSALDYAESAYELENTNIWINRLLIELYRVNDKFDSAIDITEKSISQNPNSIELEFTLASLYHDSGKDKKALEILSTIENSYGVSEEVSLSKHEILAELGKEKDAEEELVKLIELNPDEYRFQGMLAEFYSSIGQNEKAEQIYTNLLEKNPGNPFIVLSAAEHFRNVNKFKEAKELYALALKDKGFDLNNKIRTIISLISNQDFFTTQNDFIGNLIDSLILEEGENVKLLTLRADFNIRKGNFASAENDLSKILDLDQNNLIIWEQFLYINNRQNDNETLLEYSKRALNYFPEQANFYLFKGLAEMNLSSYDKSVSSFKSGLKLVQDNDPLELQFLTFLGDVYRNMGNNKKSDEYFEKVLEKDPNNMIVLNNYSYYLSLREEKLDLAEQYSRKTVENEPNNSTYLDTYAWILFKLREYNNAKKYIERAIENNGSTNSEILDHYGDILAKIKEYQDAVKYWKLAIEFGGEKDSIQEKINSVLHLVNEE